MLAENAQLLARIESFDIDGGPVAWPFASRLARENGWSKAYANRVIMEYKRFVFLAMISETHVCPSEDVDAAWHLHLTYTKSYWKRFCSEVLGRPLHHDPTKGGPAEVDKHVKMYAGTFAAYRAAFGAEPPADIWTPAGERFGEDLSHRAVNTSRNWVIPKDPVKRVAQLTALIATVAAFVPGCQGGLDPFALEGIDFLVFLVPMMIGAICLGFVMRSRMQGQKLSTDEETLDLSWDRVAYLAGGAPRLTTAAVARSAARGALVVEGDKLVRGSSELPEGGTNVELTVMSSLPCTNTPSTLKQLVKAVDAAYADDASELIRDGYLMSANARLGARFLAVLPILVVLLVFAMPRIVMGVSNNKASGYLIASSVFGMVIGLVIALSVPLRLTRRGEYVLKNLKERRQTLQVGSSWHGADDAALAVALFGTFALGGSTIAGLQSWYPRSTPANSTGGCGTYGCGTGGCSGGGGGGDGGGGGCGGCGGGGGD